MISIDHNYKLIEADVESSNDQFSFLKMISDTILNAQIINTLKKN